MYKIWLFGQNRALEESEKSCVIYFGENFYKNTQHIAQKCHVRKYHEYVGLFQRQMHIGYGRMVKFS